MVFSVRHDDPEVIQNMINGPYPIALIGKIIDAQLIGKQETEASIYHLLTDSRQIRFADQSLFFALIGPHHDGHQFLQQAYLQGIRHFVVSDLPSDWPFPNGFFLLVKNTVEALQKLGRFHRQQFNLPVLGITGSNGKTTVKEWLFNLLQDDYHICRSPRSYNSQIGVPLSVWPLRAAHQLGIFEAGISQTAEMDILESIIRPTIGLLTNIGSAHDAGFTNRTEKLAEKLKLFQNAEVIIFQAQGDEIEGAIKALNRPIFSWSFDCEADLRIEQLEQQFDSCIIKARYRGQAIQIQIPFTDIAATQNAIHCWAVCLYLGLATERIALQMMELSPIAMRLELQEGRNACTLINDSYNSDLQSLSIALDFAQQQRGNSKLSLILSDILQSGISDDDLYQEVASLIDQSTISQFIGVGTEIKRLDQYLDQSIPSFFFPDTASLLEQLEDIPFQQETILIKGARPFAFETIARQLLPHTHRTVLEVNLSALAHNLRVFSAQVKPETKMMVMVKAAAYGGGSAEIARLLHFHGIHYLAVAYVDEGVELRKAGITLPIMVLNPEPVTFSTLLRYQLEPEIYSLDQLNALINFMQTEDSPLSIHLKLDTGMHRLGFLAADLVSLQTLLEHNPLLRVASIFSHLSASEDSNEDNFTHHQAEAFSSMYEKITAFLNYKPLQHLLNSAGIIRFPQYHKDMVRLGIGMYGIEVCPELKGKLRTAFRLRSRISQIRQVEANETVGYNRKGIAPKARKIATISIGYADGLLRKAGNAQYAFRLQDKLAPTVGNICMDMCMIDVSDIPNAREGDEVLIFGEELPIEHLAATYNTIPYEVLTGISARVKRLYVME